ncbi:MAG: hypothetical protein LBK72_07780 [Bifidobacteriaceae bacterium]|nr:hypothetical protein [Bifidobacteriaceae bacterium]
MVLTSGPRLRVAVMLVVGALVPAVLLAGCRSDGEVPLSSEDSSSFPAAASPSSSPRGGSPGAGGEASAEEEYLLLSLPIDSSSLSAEGLVAQSFYECLVDAGAPLTAVPLRDGGLYLDFSSHAVDSALGQDPSGAVTWDLISEDRHSSRALAEVVANHGDGYVLEVNGSDLSQQFEACHTQHPYVPPEYGLDVNPLNEVKAEAHALPDTRRWAQCARENGFPTVVDPPDPMADGNSEVIAVVPLTTAPKDLEVLLETCPRYTGTGQHPVVVDVRPESPAQAREPGGSLAGTSSENGDEQTAMYAELMEVTQAVPARGHSS